MHFVLTCVDKPDHGQVRTDNRPAHLDYLKANEARMFAAGPLLSDDGERTLGSLIIMEFDGLGEAQAFADGDPYAKAGLFESVTIRAWRKVLP